MLHGPLRPAYTLLEMLLATAISALLLGALYVAVSMQLRHAQAGRDVIEQTTLARALLTRMGRDIRLCVTPAAPTPFLLGPGPSSGSGSPSSSGSATGSSGQTGSPVGSGSRLDNASSPSSGSSTSNAGSQQQQQGMPANNQVVLGVRGAAKRLTLYVSRLPDGRAGGPPTSDLRLITYWLAQGGGRPLGLARMESAAVTADPAVAQPPTNNSDDGSHVIAQTDAVLR